ncbi:MAG: hypothetical protein PHW40_08200, partial [Candidatus Izemoplasmatales bacterium]|nr:hypothetical protein [Candidatus Izemoplasmatales bacterium]
MQQNKTKNRIAGTYIGLLVMLFVVLGLSACGNITTFEPKELEDADSYMSVYYVSPFGDDTNDGGYDTPFETITKAQEVVRATNQNMTSDIAVVIRE